MGLLSRLSRLSGISRLFGPRVPVPVPPSEAGFAVGQLVALIRSIERQGLSLGDLGVITTVSSTPEGPVLSVHFQSLGSARALSVPGANVRVIVPGTCPRCSEPGAIGSGSHRFCPLCGLRWRVH